MDFNSRLGLILLSLFITFPLCNAANLFSKDNTNVLSTISDDLFYSYDSALLQLDSLKAICAENELEKYSSYLNYIDAFIARKNDNYHLAFELSNAALFSFIKEGDKEWEGKCLLLVGFIAEKMGLNEEALEAYKEAVSVCESYQNKGLAYLGLARSQKRLFLEWESALDDGILCLEKTGKKELQLYAMRSPYWYYPDSINLATDLLYISSEYEKLGMYSHAAVTFKIMARYYNKMDSSSLADSYIDKSISNLNKETNISLISLASAIYVKGEIQQKSGNVVDARHDFLESIALVDSAGHSQCNFNVYRNLFRQDTSLGDLESAVVNLSAALNSKHEMGLLKAEWSRKIGVALRDRSELINDILRVRKRNNRRMLSVSILLFFLVSYYVLILRRRKRKAEINYKTIKTLMKDSLLEVKQKQVSHYIQKSKSDIDLKVDRHLFSKPELVSYIKDNSVNMLLHIENKMACLTEREKKCTSLIALGCSNKDLEELLSVKSDTIRTYRSRIRAKLHIEDRNTDLKTEILRLLKEE